MLIISEGNQFERRSVMNRTLGTATTAAVLLLISTGSARAQEPTNPAAAVLKPHIMLTPDEVKWEDCPPMIPAGAKCATIEGDRKAPNVPFTYRLKMPDNYRIAPHFHPPCQKFPATGQTTAFEADKNDGIPGPVAVPDDGTVEAGATLSYTDNPDGTITDNNTGLQWEKKSDDNGLHDKDNTYGWSRGAFADPDFSETIWDWLEDVNAENGTGFAGFNDWRVPNVKELHSIVDYEVFPGPVVSAAFNNSCDSGLRRAATHRPDVGELGLTDRDHFAVAEPH
jgi:hypothetical protein